MPPHRMNREEFHAQLAGRGADEDDAATGAVELLVDLACEMGDYDNGVTISPGDQRRGCLVFEVADDRDARLFQFTPDSGFGPNTGEWQL